MSHKIRVEFSEAKLNELTKEVSKLDKDSELYLILDEILASKRLIETTDKKLNAIEVARDKRTENIIKKIKDAIIQLTNEKKKISKTAIHKLTKISRPTIDKYYEELTSKKN